MRNLFPNLIPIHEYPSCICHLARPHLAYLIAFTSSCSEGRLIEVSSRNQPRFPIRSKPLAQTDPGHSHSYTEIRRIPTIHNHHSLSTHTPYIPFLGSNPKTIMNIGCSPTHTGPAQPPFHPIRYLQGSGIRPLACIHTRCLHSIHSLQ